MKSGMDGEIIIHLPAEDQLVVVLGVIIGFVFIITNVPLVIGIFSCRIISPVSVKHLFRNSPPAYSRLFLSKNNISL
jgi:hypothetical protein